MDARGGLSYDLAFKRRLWLKWLLAISLAIVLNAAMFLALPSFVILSDRDSELLQVMPVVNVIRLKRNEDPAKKEPPPPPPPKQQPKKKPLPQKTAVAIPKLSLPFVLSPEMPSAPATLSFDPVKAGDFSLVGAPDGVDAAQLDDALMPLSRVPPVYPIRAKRRGQEGWVKARFLIDREGRVQRVTIVESEPEKIFDKSVVQCISRWRFKPGTVEGVPVNAWAETTIRFELEN